MRNFSFSFPAVPVHIHSVDQTMGEWSKAVERDMSPNKRCLTNMEPFLSMNHKSIIFSALANLKLLKTNF